MTIPRKALQPGNIPDILRIIERFKKGRIGQVYEGVASCDEVKSYFSEHLVCWSEKKLAEMTPRAGTEFKKFVTPEILWQSFFDNFALNAYVSGMTKWLSAADDTFDDLIIAFATPENAVRVIDALRNSLEKKATEVQGKDIDAELMDAFFYQGLSKKGKQFFS